MCCDWSSDIFFEEISFHCHQPEIDVLKCIRNDKGSSVSPNPHYKRNWLPMKNTWVAKYFSELKKANTAWGLVCLAIVQKTSISTRHVIEISFNIFCNISSPYRDTAVTIRYGDFWTSRADESVYRWIVTALVAARRSLAACCYSQISNMYCRYNIIWGLWRKLDQELSLDPVLIKSAPGWWWKFIFR